MLPYEGIKISTRGSWPCIAVSQGKTGDKYIYFSSSSAQEKSEVIYALKRGKWLIIPTKRFHAIVFWVRVKVARVLFAADGRNERGRHRLPTVRGPAETGIAEPRVVHDVLCAMMQQSEAQGEFRVQQFDDNITSIRRKAPFKLQVLCGVDYLFKDLVLTAIGEGRLPYQELVNKDTEGPARGVKWSLKRGLDVCVCAVCVGVEPCKTNCPK